MKQKRERLEIIHDILNVIMKKNNKIKPTHLLYKSNLSHKMMKEYIDYLTEKNLIENKNEGKNNFFCLTDKGFQYLEKYLGVLEFMDSFGL